MARAPDAPWCLDGIPARWSEAGPVHLVAHSYGGPPAIVVALEHPDLVRSSTLAEPAIGALLTDPPEGKLLLDERAQAMKPVLTAVKTGDTVRALTLAFDWVNN